VQVFWVFRHGVKRRNFSIAARGLDGSKQNTVASQ
jgi:hypothetical protein